MDFLSVEILGILINLTSVCLWGITMLYFIKTKTKYNDDVFKYAGNEVAKPFDEEVFNQMLKQRSECSLNRISDFIGSEKRPTRALGRNSEVRSGNIQKSKVISNGTLGIHQKMNKMPVRNANTGDNYKEAVRLADLGMNAKEISEKVKVPKGEIELLIKLREK